MNEVLLGTLVEKENKLPGKGDPGYEGNGR
jgi:hypothetical protein